MKKSYTLSDTISYVRNELMIATGCTDDNRPVEALARLATKMLSDPLILSELSLNDKMLCGHEKRYVYPPSIEDIEDIGQTYYCLLCHLESQGETKIYTSDKSILRWD